MNKLLLAVATVLIAIAPQVLAQESRADPLVGKWVGDWDSRGRPAGSMEIVVDVKGDKVFGEVRSTGSPGCSLEWEKFAGVVEGNKVSGHYNLGGRCGKVDIIYTIDQGEKVISGSW